LSITKHWALQKLGTIDPSPEPQEWKEMINRFVNTRIELINLVSLAEQSVKSRATVISDTSAFTDSLAKLGSHSKVGNVNSETVRIYTSAATRLQGFQRDIDRAFMEMIVNPVNFLLQREVKTTFNLMNKYEDYHLDYDARTDRFKSLQERSDVAETPKRVNQRAEAKADLEVATSNYESVKQELVKICNEVEKKRNSILTDNLAAYMKSQLVFCANSMSALEQHTYSDKK